MTELGAQLHIPQDLVEYLLFRRSAHSLDPHQHILALLRRDMQEYYGNTRQMQQRQREQLGLRNDTTGNALQHYIVATQAGITALPLQLLEAMREDEPTASTLRWRINNYLSSGDDVGYLLEVSLRGFGFPPDAE